MWLSGQGNQIEARHRHNEGTLKARSRRAQGTTGPLSFPSTCKCSLRASHLTLHFSIPIADGGREEGGGGRRREERGAAQAAAAFRSTDGLASAGSSPSQLAESFSRSLLIPPLSSSSCLTPSSALPLSHATSLTTVSPFGCLTSGPERSAGRVLTLPSLTSPSTASTPRPLLRSPSFHIFLHLPSSHYRGRDPGAA